MKCLILNIIMINQLDIYMILLPYLITIFYLALFSSCFFNFCKITQCLYTTKTQRTIYSKIVLFNITTNISEIKALEIYILFSHLIIGSIFFNWEGWSKTKCSISVSEKYGKFNKKEKQNPSSTYPAIPNSLFCDIETCFIYFRW